MGTGLLSSTCFGGSTVIKYGKTGPILKRLSTVDLADHLDGEAQGLGKLSRRCAGPRRRRKRAGGSGRGGCRGGT